MVPKVGGSSPLGHPNSFRLVRRAQGRKHREGRGPSATLAWAAGAMAAQGTLNPKAQGSNPWRPTGNLRLHGKEPRAQRPWFHGSRRCPASCAARRHEGRVRCVRVRCGVRVDGRSPFATAVSRNANGLSMTESSDRLPGDCRETPPGSVTSIFPDPRSGSTGGSWGSFGTFVTAQTLPHYVSGRLLWSW